MNRELIWRGTPVSAVVDECGCKVVAESEQYLPLELALHTCFVEEPGPSRHDVLSAEGPRPAPFTLWRAS